MARRSDVDLLEALLEGRTAPEDAPRALSRLTGLATAVREHTEVEAPSDEFRTRFREELLATAAAGRVTLWDRLADRVHDATAGMRYSLRTAGAAAMASTMIATTGVAAAAQSALPGDALYSVKGLTEDARLAFASGDVERGRLHLAFARERLEEVEEGRERLAPEQLTATLGELDHEASTGADELLRAAADGTTTDPVLDELDAFTAELRTRILDLSGVLPLSVRPATEHTLELLRRIDVQVAGLLDLDSCEVCNGIPAGSPRIVLPGDGPAAPPCRCVEPSSSAATGDDGDAEDAADQPTPQEQPAGGATVPDAPSSGDVGSSPGTSVGTGTGEVVGDVVDGVGDVVDGVGDAVGDVGSTVGDTVGDVGGTVGDTVGDVGSAVDDTVDKVVEPVEDVGTIVDDLIAPSPSSTGGVVGDVTGGVGDVVDEVGDTVEDTASEVGDTVGDLTGGLTGGLLD